MGKFINENEFKIEILLSYLRGWSDALDTEIETLNDLKCSHGLAGLSVDEIVSLLKDSKSNTTEVISKKIDELKSRA